jgi:hypothetical protein
MKHQLVFYIQPVVVFESQAESGIVSPTFAQAEVMGLLQQRPVTLTWLRRKVRRGS